MTDKEKILAEIERLIKYDEMLADHNSQIMELVSRELDCLYHLSKFINSLPEEPVSKLWHDASEEPEGKKEIVFHHTEGFYSIGIYSKEKKMINEGIAAWAYDDIDKWCYLSDIIENELPSKQEEPVSEDLEEAAKEYAKAKHQNEALIDIVSMDFKAGAQWQKKRTINKDVEYLKNFLDNSPLIEYQVSSDDKERISEDLRKALEN